MMNTIIYPQSVRVCAYVRFRLGKREHVCQHWRSWPKG